ncbi:unnamed protein product [Closterium sp. NIES-53]
MPSSARYACGLKAPPPPPPPPALALRERPIFPSLPCPRAPCCRVFHFLWFSISILTSSHLPNSTFPSLAFLIFLQPPPRSPVSPLPTSPPPSRGFFSTPFPPPPLFPTHPTHSLPHRRPPALRPRAPASTTICYSHTASQSPSAPSVLSAASSSPARKQPSRRCFHSVCCHLSALPLYRARPSFETPLSSLPIAPILIAQLGTTLIVVSLVCLLGPSWHAKATAASVFPSNQPPGASNEFHSSSLPHPPFSLFPTAQDHPDSPRGNGPDRSGALLPAGSFRLLIPSLPSYSPLPPPLLPSLAQHHSHRPRGNDPHRSDALLPAGAVYSSPSIHNPSKSPLHLHPSLPAPTVNTILIAHVGMALIGVALLPARAITLLLLSIFSPFSLALPPQHKTILISHVRTALIGMALFCLLEPSVTAADNPSSTLSFILHSPPLHSARLS